MCKTSRGYGLIRPPFMIIVACSYDKHHLEGNVHSSQALNKIAISVMAPDGKLAFIH
jgi:hypothetical protein